ncbi:unnamed protein product [Oikopleura dioica]|uniref:Uncharacterized protein n=1 Tax=Oikopleura dioica TaxID=34765 RepID=E4Z5C0_OIKDI|nr:unnamed protein product [Oikopleura dioica]
MRCASILFVASVIGETICKFNGIRRKRNIREIETDFSKDSDPNAMNVFLLRIEGSSLTRLSEFTSDKLQIVFDENENYETLVTVENPVETQYLCCDESIVHVDMYQACQLLDFRKQEIPSEDTFVEENPVQDDHQNANSSENGSNTTVSADFSTLNVLSAIQSSFTKLYGFPGLIILLIGLLFGALLAFLCKKFCIKDDRDAEISNEQINSLLLKSEKSTGSTGSFDYRESMAETLYQTNTLTA